MRALLRDWRFWLALAALSALVIWLAYQGDMTCRIPRKRAQMEIVKANSCFEFWLNRYQQIIAAALAVGAAALTIRQINSQIAEGKKQTAAAALDPTRGTLAEYDNILRQCRHCYSEAQQHVRDAIAHYPQPDTTRGLWGSRSPDHAFLQARQVAQEVSTHVRADDGARAFADALNRQTAELSDHMQTLAKMMVPIPGPSFAGELVQVPEQPNTTIEKAEADALCSKWLSTMVALEEAVKNMAVQRREHYLRLEETVFGNKPQR